MPIHLRRTDENLSDIDALADGHAAKVGLDHVLEHLNRQAHRVRAPGSVVGEGIAWNDTDAHTTRWMPQGITTSADACGHDEGRRLLVTSWYSKGVEDANQGSRITVMDLDTLAYRHVLLVVPTRNWRGKVGFKPLLAHAGGLVWCGPYLHVAGTRRGLFSCHLDDVLQIPASDHRASDDAFGYRYVLPVRFGYDSQADEGTERMRYSFLSLDRGADPPELVAGEYGSGDMTRRLVRYPLDPVTQHLAAHEDGSSRPVWLDERGPGHMQGAAVVDGTYYVTTSSGSRTRGSLHIGEPGHWRTLRRVLPIGPEDITYWPSTDTFWSLSEHPGHRYVFSVPRRPLI